ncbi:MAG: amidase [Ilumatobacteraceae bacterium]
MDLSALGAAELSVAIHGREVSCREVMAAHLARIDERNPALNAIVNRRDPDVLIAEAAACDDELAAGSSRGWMHGMPQAIKELADVAGLPTTSGSPLLRDFVPKADALVVRRMRAAGCLIVGKTNVPEFGLGSHTFNEVFGPTRNPYDTSRTPGGSSGGAAVALATSMLPVADGSDYMGSLRNPAAWCNVFGFRPSRGRVPAFPERDGFLGGLATEGPMGRRVLDVALLLGTQAGEDRRVPGSLSGRLDELATIEPARRALDAGGGLRGTRVGWLGDLGGHLPFEDGVLDVARRGVDRLAVLGADVEPAAIPVDLDELWEAWLVWRQLLVGAGLGPLAAAPARRLLIKPEALWEIDQGANLTGAQVAWASEARTRFALAMHGVFERFDVLAIPTAQVWPFPVEQRWPATVGGRAMDTYHRWMEVTTYATFAGLPAISVPAGFDDRGLPMGLQLIGPPRDDVAVLRVAARYETTIADLGVGCA